MTKGDQPSWMVARRGLDHKETVDVLAGGLTGVEPFDRETAGELASALARAGLVLVRMDVEQARDFFSRKEDV